MKSKQVLSIEQMKNLQKLGLDTSDASMVLIAIDDDSCPLDWETALEAMSTYLYDVSFDLFDADLPYYDHSYRKKCGVFTLQDILDKLPHYLNPFPSKQILFAWMIERDTIAYRNVENVDDCLKHFTDNSLIDAAYEMLCWCVENGYVKEDGE